MNLKVLLCHPGASWSTADVYDGLHFGLKSHGVQVIPFRLDQRIEATGKSLHALWRVKKREDPTLPKPNQADLLYHAGLGSIEMALRHRVDVVFVVSAMMFYPDLFAMMQQARLRVVVLFTESPYDVDKELQIAKMISGGWTTERTSVATFRSVNPNMGYLPHGWHPDKHFQTAQATTDLPVHDVVFVGSGFPERITFFNSIDWTGIDLGLYGTWDKALGLKPQVQKFVRGNQVDNLAVADLYRKARVNLNLYRRSQGWRSDRTIPSGESLSPRAYELAACGAFHLSDDRPEVHEVFGDSVPTFRTPAEAAALIRLWLADESGRRRLAAQLPARVAEASWVNRAATVLGDLHRLIHVQAA